MMIDQAPACQSSPIYSKAVPNKRPYSQLSCQLLEKLATIDGPEHSDLALDI